MSNRIFKIITILIYLIGFGVVFLTLTTLFSSCKSKQVKCDAYSYKHSIEHVPYITDYTNENYWDDDKLVQIDDTTFLLEMQDENFINIDSLIR
jgi:hypothetical protein